MQLSIELTPNKISVPTSYQEVLIRFLHKSLGHNPYHDDISLYSFSSLQGSKFINGYYEFKNGAKWFVSGYQIEFLERLIKGFFEDSNLNYGMEIKSITNIPTPEFSNKERFEVASPVFIKRNEIREGKEHQQFYYYYDSKSALLLTETLQNKLQKVGLEDPKAIVYFDSDYQTPKTKLVTIKNRKYKASMCPVIIEAKPETIAFAWNVGVGNNTGMGFGALR